MGLFDWFRKPKSSRRLPDLIWLSDDAKFRGFAGIVASALMQRSPVVVVSHFESTMASACDAMEAARIDFDFEPNRLGTEGILKHVDQHDGRVLALLASSLSDVDPDEQWNQIDESLSTLSIVVVERHPLKREDDRIEKFAECLNCPSQLSFLLSLDDPLMRKVVGESVRAILARLGMHEDETIESPLVARQVTKAQDKIDRAAYGNANAYSPEEWFDLNCQIPDQ